MLLGVLALSSTSAFAQSPPSLSSTDTPTPDECGPPGALPGLFRCESQTTQTDGDYFYNLEFINRFRARIPYTTLNNTEISQWGHWVCKHLETYSERGVVQAWVNNGWSWDDAQWVVDNSKAFFCPAPR
ncbi:hypothetical protein [Streptomyces sp. NBC_01006]|uniref:hypothetical protein n=1 Tax=Streptomyces sp. NBC_01006 TaxID=2903716 RepID=UPI00386FCF30|nr:hypothetical protein OG509_42050 [Streptomyces sp. NBC_01006]